MSYILDALKKSEEERHQGQVPSLGGGSTLIHSSAHKSVMWPWVIAALLLFNMLFIAYWLLSADVGDSHSGDVSDDVSQRYIEESNAPVAYDQDVEPVIVHQQNKMRVDPVIYPDEAIISPEYAVPKTTLSKATRLEYKSTEPELITPSVAVIEEPMIITPKSGARPYAGPVYDDISEEVIVDEPDLSSVKHVSDFPQSFQRRIPDLMFNSHIFTDTPSSRRVMINNVYLREGQVFSGLKVVQITEEGVVLSLDDEAFNVGVLRDWQSPR